ncbi:ABC transporter ATP-binding protein [Granulicella cerasi]|uniref:ABC transporter ATP-binding protein n=1 Tax=Granulicella cerasi TaxID=741063 RepID=UPI0021DFA4E6|nr:ABC transporter ATP-binding protein [Granulicella cerasi]
MSAAETTPLLEVRDLRVRFGAFEAVHGASFSLAPGETLGLVGESGSGKSATSLALMGLLPATASTEGAVRLGGANLLALDEAAMRRQRGSEIAMIFQEPMTALNPVMPIGRQIAEAVEAHHPKLKRSEVKERVLRVLHDVALPDPERRYNDYPHQFSGGQRQRIVIAMALVNRPKLVIADEPTTALDVTVQAQVLTLLRRLRAEYGLAMIFISHDLAVVGQVADRIAVMQRGHIVEMGEAAQVLRAPQHAYTQQLLAALPTMTTDRTRPLASVAPPAVS